MIELVGTAEYVSPEVLEKKFSLIGPIVDIGPKAGTEGGHLIFNGTPEEIMKCDSSITGRYLSGKEKIEVPKSRRKGNGKSIKITGCKENNLKRYISIDTF